MQVFNTLSVFWVKEASSGVTFTTLPYLWTVHFIQRGAKLRKKTQLISFTSSKPGTCALITTVYDAGDASRWDTEWKGCALCTVSICRGQALRQPPSPLRGLPCFLPPLLTQLMIFRIPLSQSMMHLVSCTASHLCTVLGRA